MFAIELESQRDTDSLNRGNSQYTLSDSASQFNWPPAWNTTPEERGAIPICYLQFGYLL